MRVVEATARTFRRPAPLQGLPRRLTCVLAAVLISVSSGCGGGDEAEEEEPFATSGWPAPVSIKPEATWAWESGGSVEAADGSSDLVVAALLTDGLVALDKDGKEKWRDRSAPFDGVAMHEEAGLITTGFTEPSGATITVAFDFDGNRLWESSKNELLWEVLSDGSLLVLRDESSLVRVDPHATDQDGDTQKWTVAVGDQSTNTVVTRSSVITLVDDVVTSYRLTDGSVRWRNRADGATKMLGNDKLVVVGGEGLVAFNTVNGRQLWSEPDRISSLHPLADDQVIAIREDDWKEEGPFSIYDADGPAGKLIDADGSDVYNLVMVDIGGAPGAVSKTSGRLYDEDGEAIGKGYEAIIEYAAGGGYRETETGFAYRAFGASDVAWSVELNDVNSIGVVDLELQAFDKGLVVHDEDTLWRYE